MRGFNPAGKLLHVVICIITALSLSGCSEEKDAVTTAADTEKLVVFAASSLTESFKRLGSEFEKQQGGKAKILFNFAGSQVLRASIEAGAQADAFISADIKNMEALEKSGLINKYDVLVKNRLTLVVGTASKYDVKNMADMGLSGLKLAVADKSVPAGTYWEEALENAVKSGELTREQLEAVNANVLTRELNVKDVLSKVLLGEVDAGVVYGTDAIAADSNRVKEVAISGLSIFNASYTAAVLKASENKESANQFYDYLFSDSAKDILKGFGFLTE